MADLAACGTPVPVDDREEDCLPVAEVCDALRVRVLDGHVRPEFVDVHGLDGARHAEDVLPFAGRELVPPQPCRHLDSEHNAQRSNLTS